jgi:diaminopimelate epimerase
MKMHGAGNDFVLLDLMSPQTVFSSPGSDVSDEQWAALAREMCDRHFGIGSDGLLLVMPSAHGDARMRMFNPDGSESASCGNGIRCLGRYVQDRYGRGTGSLRVETGAGLTTITANDDGTVTVDMGQPILSPRDIPTTLGGDKALGVPLDIEGEQMTVSCVSMGNPHAIIFVGHGVLDNYPLEVTGPKVEHHAAFPQRTNFEVCEVVASDRMRVRVWERGAGITLACGTGACASTVAAALDGRLTPPASVELPGGTLTIDWSPGGSVLMTGPAEYVFSGTYPRPAWWEAQAPTPAPEREAAVVG